MIKFFKTSETSVIAVQMSKALSQQEIDALCWLFGGAEAVDSDSIDGYFVGPRREMVTPWSTNAVEITQNMNIGGIVRNGRGILPNGNTQILPGDTVVAFCLESNIKKLEQYFK